MTSTLNAMATMSMTGMPSSTGNASSSMSTGTPKAGMSGMDMGGSGSSCKISMLWNWNTIDACFISHSWHIKSSGGFAGACIGTILLVICLELLRRVGRDYDSYIMRRALIRRLYASGISTTSSEETTKAKIRNIISGQGDHGRTDNDQNTGNEDLITPVCCPTSENNATDSPACACNKIPNQAVSENSLAQQQIKNLQSEPYRPSPVEQVVRALLHMVQFAVAYFVMLLAMYYNGYIIICIFIGAFLGSLIFSWEPISLGKENDATAVTKCCG